MDVNEWQRTLRARSGAGAKLRGATHPEPAAVLRVAVGADHGGFDLKAALTPALRAWGYEVDDVGTTSCEPVDYPDFAVAVARRVASGACALGIAIDAAGLGSCMAANKVRGVRAATCHDEATVRNSREHNNANVSVLGSRVVNAGYARRLVRIWLATPFAGGRHEQRVRKIDALDEER